jgi:hypothetical protein
MSYPPSPADDTPSQLRVRPYLLTGGRTQVDIDLPLESLIRATEDGTATVDELNLEREQIVRLCQEPISVTEVAARLGLPIQVGRVIIADLINEGLVQAHVAQAMPSERPDLNLLERVLDGLQSL